MSKVKFIQELKASPSNGAREEIIKKVKDKKPLIVTNLKDAKILISRVIYHLQTGDVDVNKANQNKG